MAWSMTAILWLKVTILMFFSWTMFSTESSPGDTCITTTPPMWPHRWLKCRGLGWPHQGVWGVKGTATLVYACEVPTSGPDVGTSYTYTRVMDLDHWAVSMATLYISTLLLIIWMSVWNILSVSVVVMWWHWKLFGFQKWSQLNHCLQNPSSYLFIHLISASLHK